MIKIMLWKKSKAAVVQYIQAAVFFLSLSLSPLAAFFQHRLSFELLCSIWNRVRKNERKKNHRQQCGTGIRNQHDTIAQLSVLFLAQASI